MRLAESVFLHSAPCHRASADTGSRNRHALSIRAMQASLIALCSTFAVTSANAAGGDTSDQSAASPRAYIATAAGGLTKLQVPPQNTDLSLPLQPHGFVKYRYTITEAQRHLGKLIFHDPARTVSINKNMGQPVDLPAGTAFGGTENATDPTFRSIVEATRQTGSCGSCHIGEAAGKAGQVLNFNVCREGRGYIDAFGNFVLRRRPQSILTTQRSAPIFPGDALVDVLPKLTDVDLYEHSTRAKIVVTDPSRFYHKSPPAFLLATGRLDELDSVWRQSPSMIGAGFNNRLLLGGFAGEPQSALGSLNPFKDPAQEDLTLLLLHVHCMLNFESEALQKVPVFMELFRDAFPQEAALFDTSHDSNDLVNDQIVSRATATFLRTVVTRNTPFDNFLAGNNNALTAGHARGARLFFTPAASAATSAQC